MKPVVLILRDSEYWDQFWVFFATLKIKLVIVQRFQILWLIDILRVITIYSYMLLFSFRLFRYETCDFLAYDGLLNLSSKLFPT